MLGNKTLFHFFESGEPGKQTEKKAAALPARKGRSAAEIARRNEYLLYRYYYLRTHTDKHYEAIILQLNEEVWLSTTTITEIIMDHTGRLAEIKTEQPTAARLQKRWPHIKW